ncbi:hypothetical protein D9615_009583, partial [Tricholomella constricta]
MPRTSSTPNPAPHTNPINGDNDSNRPAKRSRKDDGNPETTRTDHEASRSEEYDLQEEDIETIDDPDSRPKRPEPRRKMADTFVFPNAFDMKDLPTLSDQNPAIQQSCQGPLPFTPAPAAIAFTRAALPRSVIPMTTLLNNLHLTISEEVEKNPENYLAIVPFGAGNRLFRDHPHLNTDIVNFLRSLGIGSEDQKLSISRPVARSRPNQRRDFEKPWTMVLDGASAELRSFLLWQQTFAISR